MSQTEAQNRASKKYHEKFDDIKIRVPKGERKIWQDYAASRGESLNSFVRRTIKESMERELRATAVANLNVIRYGSCFIFIILWTLSFIGDTNFLGAGSE